MQRIGIVILSRVFSDRVHKKPLSDINGKSLIEHLVIRCLATGLPVCVAVPENEYEHYTFLLAVFSGQMFTLFCGDEKNPLKRMADAISLNGWEYAIRVSHDKIFLEKSLVSMVVSATMGSNSDYGILKNPMDGIHFEVIKSDVIREASKNYDSVEHITYAVKLISKKEIIELPVPTEFHSDHRLLIDYPNDLKMINLVMKSLGNDTTLSEVLSFLDQHYWVSKINRRPIITVYTCGYNAEKWISKAMGSISMQQNFSNFEYILIDDASRDATPAIMQKFCSVYKNAKFVRNEINIGLSSSSNIALKLARGRYVIRLDADDFLTTDHVLNSMVNSIESKDVDVIYPDNYFGSFKVTQKGIEAHHIGGAMFKTKSANFVRFTDGLRGFEGLDFFHRSKNQLKIGYYEKPTFFYRQHDSSLSKNNLDKREKLKKEILEKYGAI